MKISILDLSRNSRAPDERLNPVFRGAEVGQLDKAAWKRLGPLALLRSVRAIRSDLFVIAVDEFATAQDEFLLHCLGACSRARAFAMLEMSTGRLQYLGRGRVLVAEAALQLANAALTLLFGVFFLLLIGALFLAARLRHRGIRNAYGRAREHVRRVMYLKSDLALNITAGGSIAHTRGVIGGFLANGRAVSIVSNEDAPWLRVDGAELTVVGTTRWFGVIRETERISNGLYLAWRTARHVRRERPDVIYQRKCLLDVSGVLLSLWFGIPLVIEGNDSVVRGLYWERARLKWVSGVVERLQFTACTRAVCISEPLFETFRQLGYDTARIRVIFNGVDAERFNTPDSMEQGRALRQKLGLAEGHILVGFVGTFGQWHGINTLTAAIVELAAGQSPFTFILIGDGELRAGCERTIRAAGCADRVHFLGLLPASQVPGCLAACDLLVSPHSRSPDGRKFFGSPTKLFEYMAAARAIIASDLDQIGEVLESEKSALLFEPDSMPAFVGALRRAAADRDLRTRLAHEARRVVEARYTWRANVATLIESMP